MASPDSKPNFHFRRPAHRLERASKMTQESLQRQREPLIKADLGENGGRIQFGSIPDASQWIDREIEAWRRFGESVGASPLRKKVMDRQLALPLNIAERLVQAISLEDDELSKPAMEIEGLLEKYADYHSLHSESGLGMAIRKIKTPRSQRAGIGGLACSIGIPAYEVLDMAGAEDQGIVDVVTGYALGRELNVVKRSEISRHEERMEEYIVGFDSIVAEANTTREETKDKGERLLAVMTEQAESRERSWNEFAESADSEWTKLRTTFDVQLRLEAPASYWGKEAKRTYEAAIASLILFATIAIVIIGILVGYGPSFLEALANIKGGGGYASVALISIPALTALWILRHVARLFVTNLERTNDARVRETMATTFLALTKEGASTAEEKERLLVLEALFRPPGAKQTDDGHFGGALEILTRRDGQS